ncbi:MAG TPA: patatin-like protein [Abditibacteriaceae bacterium]|jgi:patatin-related protein
MEFKDDTLLDYQVTDQMSRREVRVAVSMVGGSSLAIYENGVAQELFRMAHGRGAYGVLKRITHSHAYVDILSGTSAGGINTIFLSTALTLGTDLPGTRADWIRLGNIDDLLHSASNTRARSLLNGNRYYLEELEGVFERLCDPRNLVTWPAREKGGVPSGIDEATGAYGDLDLFVTGTYFRAQPQVFFDARVQPILNNNYAGVFRMKHRARREESHFDARLNDASCDKDFPQPRPDTTPARRRKWSQRLARVARTTSSLPAIFETSTVQRELMNGIIALPTDVPPDCPHYMGDGGYLNKRPLNLVLKEILGRAAHHEVARKIFFVEPVPEEIKPATANNPEPNAIEHAQFATSVPDWQNLSSSLQEIHQHNQRLQRVDEALEVARARVFQHTRPSRSQKELWIKIRLQELRDETITLWSRALGLGDAEGVSDSFQTVDALRALHERAIPLRLMRNHLLPLLEKHCEELAELHRNNERPTLLFGVDEIDTLQFKRKTLRAVKEIYDALFPPPQPGQKPLPVPPRERRHPTQARLRECYHLRDLAQIIEDNVAAVLANAVFSPEYLAVESALRDGSALEECQGKLLALWFVLVGSLRELLAEGNGTLDNIRTLPPAPPELDEQGQKRADYGTPLETEDERHLREQWNARVLRDLLEKRGQDICAALRDASDAGEQRRQRWQEQAKNGARVSFIRRLDDYLNRLIRDSAVELKEDFKLREAQLSNPSKAALTWACAALNVKTDPNAPAKDPVLGMIHSQFEALDAYLFPIERAADLKCRNALEIVQISARDVRVIFGDRDARDKLSGDMLMNLSGFLRASWRANDILSGRLDGSGAIIENLLDRARLRRVLSINNEAPTWNTAQRILAAVDAYVLCGDVCGQLFDHALPALDADGLPPLPGALDETGNYLCARYEKEVKREGDIVRSDRAQIWHWLTEGHKTEGAIPGPHSGYRLLSRWLAHRHQLEILQDEVPEVVAAAVAEHAEWQGARAARALPVLQNDATAEALQQQADELATLSAYRPDKATSAALRLAARDWAKRLFRSDNHASNGNVPDISAAKVAEYYKNDKTGAESLESLPPVVMLRRALHVTLVALHMTSNSFPATWRTSPVGKTFGRVLSVLTFFVGLFYGLAFALAQGTAAAAATRAVVLATAILSCAALAINWVAPNAIGAVRLVGLIALVAAALFYWIHLQTTPPKSPATRARRQALWKRGLMAIGFSLCAVIPAVVAYNTKRLWHPWQLAQPENLAWAMGACDLLFLLLMFALAALERPLRAASAPLGIVSLELAGNSRKGEAILKPWTEKTRRHAIASLGLDFLFIPCYVAFFSGLCVWASSLHAAEVDILEAMNSPAVVNGGLAELGIFLAWGQFVAGALDIAENVFLLRLLLNDSAPQPLWRYAAHCARWKFALIIAALLYVCVTFFILRPAS